MEKISVYAIMNKQTGKLLLTRLGKGPRIWVGLRGPAQILGKGVRETPTHKIVKFTLVMEEEE